MSKIDQLINQLCPDGVNYYELGDVTDYQRGKGLSKGEKGTGDKPIILYGQLYTTYGNYIDRIESFASDLSVQNSVLVKVGSLLLPISSTTKEAQIGRASVLRCCDAFLGGDAVSIYPHKNVIADYLMYVLNSSSFEKEKMKCVKGTTIRHLDRKCSITTRFE